MERWLASQTREPPELMLLLGLLIIAAGVWTLTGGGVERYVGILLIVVGAFNAAVGIAALRERGSDSPS